MPQMSPMNWMIILLSCSLMILTLKCFIFSLILYSKKNIKINSVNKPLWKW